MRSTKVHADDIEATAGKLLILQSWRLIKDFNLAARFCRPLYVHSTNQPLKLILRGFQR